MRGFLMLKVVNTLQLVYWTLMRDSLLGLINADCMIRSLSSLPVIDFPANASPRLRFHLLGFVQ